MKKIVYALTVIALTFSLSAVGQNKKINFLIHWNPQSQFAGYYMAIEKGYYKEAGLDVNLQHLSTNSSYSALDLTGRGQADLCTGLLTQSLIDRESYGIDIYNVLQTSQNSGLMYVSHNDLTKKSVNDFNNVKIGRWKAGFGEAADMYCKDNNISPQWIYFNSGIDLFVSKAIDATLCYSYSEYLSLLLAVGEIPENCQMRLSDAGYNFPDDAVFANGAFYRKNKNEVDRFIYATKKGWEYARKHPQEAVQVVMKYAAEDNYSTNVAMQTLMLEEVLRLQVNTNSGVADFAPVSRADFNKLVNKLIEIGKITNPVNYGDFIR